MNKRNIKSDNSKAENEDYFRKETKPGNSKTKESSLPDFDIMWPITPIKKLPKIDPLFLMNEELPEESDDEDYRPGPEDLQDQSEEETGRQSAVSSLSRNSTLDISASQYLESFDSNLLVDETANLSGDYLFKVPEENIGQRTRSKLCLSDTPLETIEKAFIPPDITTDMYDFQCDNEDWENFLKEYMQPLSNGTNDQDDDDVEEDPDYNVMAEEEEVDKEELRRDRAVKVSRKELRKLMAELFESPDEYSSDEEEEKRVRTEITNKGTKLPVLVQDSKSLEDLKKYFCCFFPTFSWVKVPQLIRQDAPLKKFAHFPISGNQPLISTNRVKKWEPEGVRPLLNPVNSDMIQKAAEEAIIREEEEPEDGRITIVTEKQRLLLEQQLRQHVQLTTQHFLQTCQHPLYGKHAKECKIMLASLLELANVHEKSIFNIFNLRRAFSLAEQWERYLLSEEGKSVISHMDGETTASKKAKKKGNFHRVSLHPSLMKLMSESVVFLYPLLLPPLGFRCDGPFKVEFISPEDSLIAIGLDEFTQYISKNQRWFDKRKNTLKTAVELLCEHLVVTKKPHQVYRHIRNVQKIEKNPLNYYRENKKAPETVHYVISFNEFLKQRPKDHEFLLLPENFRKFLKRDSSENKENNNS